MVMAFAFSDPRKMERALPAMPTPPVEHPAIMSRESEAERKGFVTEKWW